jgi:hypothetical protein
MTAASRHPEQFTCCAVGVTAIRLMGLLLACVLSGAASESTYCAFEVKVNAPTGLPLAKIPVGLAKAGTQFSTAFTDTSGTARICDAPLSAVDIVVGGDVCGLVLVKKVRPTWPTTRQVFVTYTEEDCPHFIFADHCQALLRAEDERGRPLAGARFDGRPARVKHFETPGIRIY